MIVFFSNFISEHQIPFCDAMYEKTGGGFRFVATEPLSSERLDLGFTDKSGSLPYIIKAYENDESRSEALRLGYESDIVIIGSAPDEYIEKRLAENKMTFRYSERVFKKARWRIDPRVWKYRYEKDIRYRDKNLYMLCASAYTAPDFRFFSAYPGKTYKWGYFTEVKEYDDTDGLIASKKNLSLLWAGRLIGWKRPEQAVLLADRLRKEGVDFSLDIVGSGECEQKLRGMIEKMSLGDRVRMLGAVPPEKVRESMERSDIFLFTSDKNEGWGAVLNEAMNSACAVVACREIGSVPYLIEHGVNGLIYDRTGKNSLYNNVIKLIDDEKLKNRLQKNAYKTITEVWNADVAAGRLLHLIDRLQNGGDTDYTSGPCSKD